MNIDFNAYILGAHLAACMLQITTNDINLNKFKGFFLVAGVYDLIPLLKTDVNDNVKMNLIEATDSSPMFKESTCFNRDQKLQIQILLVYGENESNEFKKQSISYSTVSLNFN